MAYRKEEIEKWRQEVLPVQAENKERIKDYVTVGQAAIAWNLSRTLAYYRLLTMVRNGKATPRKYGRETHYHIEE